MEEKITVPWERIADFFRQHTHDLRNDLNGLDLESALLQEIIAESGADENIFRIRQQLRSLGECLRRVNHMFHEPHPARYPIAASELLLILHEKHAQVNPPLEVVWREEVGDVEVSVDGEMLARVFEELLSNAAFFGEGKPVEISAFLENEHVVFEMREPKDSALNTREWGQPFFTTRHKGYGLGLWYVWRVLQANEVIFQQAFRMDEKVLVTRLLIKKEQGTRPEICFDAK